MKRTAIPATPVRVAVVALGIAVALVTGSHASDGVLRAISDQPICMEPTDLRQWYAVHAANRPDLADELDCTVVPIRFEVIIVQSIGDMSYVAYKMYGVTQEGWVSENHWTPMKF